MTNQELRKAFEDGGMLTHRQQQQISDDIFQTASFEGRGMDDPAFLNDFWANYCPEDDGNAWVREA
jgi:hypothetical protein